MSTDDVPPAPSTNSGALAYKRILLKLSGEALQGSQSHGLDPKVLAAMAEEIGQLQALGVQVGVVIGGGNIFRGLSQSATGMNRSRADHMGMLATVINCLALQDALEQRGIAAQVMSAIAMEVVAEPYNQRGAVKALQQGQVVLFAAGTGNPYFTTDTAAALRALEIGAEVMFKATKVDGVYDADPVKNPEAILFSELSYAEVLTRKLGVMDLTAVSLCQDNDLPLVVLNMNQPGNIAKVATGGRVGTRVSAKVDAAPVQ